MGPGAEVEALTSLLGAARDITITGLLLMIVYAYATGRVITPKQHDDALAEKDRQLKAKDDQIEYHKGEAQKWQSLHLESLQMGRRGVMLNEKAMELVRALTAGTNE